MFNMPIRVSQQPHKHRRLVGWVLQVSLLPLCWNSALSFACVALSNCDGLHREELWKQLQNALAKRSSQDQVIWSIFGIFWAANALLFVAVFTSNGKILEGLVVSIVSIIGIFTSIVWRFLLRRAINHIELDENLMSHIENILLEKNPELRLTKDPKSKSDIQGPQARAAMRWSILVFLSIWVLGVGIGLCLLSHTAYTLSWVLWV